jgi:GTPase Era involved in 16S rRNA processing
MSFPRKDRIMQKYYDEKILKLLKEFRNNKEIQKYLSQYYKDRVDFIEDQIVKSEFRITVVGEFSAGKSTFLNALIGRDILPHALTETTAAITYIHNVPLEHSKANKIIIHFNDEDKEDYELDISKNPNALKEYTTTQSSSVNVIKEISSVDIYTCFKDIKENVVFIDTPGLNGVADGHRELTLREIQNAHASIYLFHLRSLTKSDLEFVKILSRYQSSILFVMNFIDEIKTAEGDTLEGKLEFLKNQLKEEILAYEECRIKDIHTFGVSALKALTYKDETIKRLYSDDMHDLTIEDKGMLWKQSKFNEFEQFLWNYISSGEKNKIFGESLKQSFYGVLEDYKDELKALIAIHNARLNNEEVEAINQRIAKCDEISKSNWAKVDNFIDSRQFDLEKSFKDKIKKDLESMLEDIEQQIRSENFDSLQSAYSTNKYGVCLQNNMSNIRAKYLEFLERILAEIYQSSILRAKQYNQTVSLNEEGAPVFNKEIEYDFGQHEFEGKLQKLNIDKHSLEYDAIRMKREENNISSKIREAAVDLERKDSDLKNVETLMASEKRSMSAKEPAVKVSYEDRTVLVERAAVSLLRLFGSQYKEKTVSVRVEDTSERDKWRQKQNQIKQKYANQKDMLEKELLGIKQRKKQLETKAVQNSEILKRTNSKIADIEKRISREKEDFEEIMSRAKSEYANSERSRLINEMNELLNSQSGKIYVKLRESVMENIRSNIAVIKEETANYYEKLNEKYKKELSIMLQAKQRPIKKQEEELKDINLSINIIEEVISKLNLIN